MTSDAGFRFDTSARDLGLLVLRFAVGAAILQAGLLKAFDYQMVVESMEQSGWRMPQLAAFMVTASETLGGIGLLLGIVTPLAGMAVTAAMIDAWAVNVAGMAFWSQPFNLPFMIGLGAVALLLTGAGTYSLDERLWGRATWPRLVSITLLIVAIAAAVATWVMLNGTNPIHFTAPASGG